MVKFLVQMGCSVTVIDDLSTGNREAAKECEFIHGNIGSLKFLEDVFSKNCFEAVFHFAAFSHSSFLKNRPMIYLKGGHRKLFDFIHQKSTIFFGPTFFFKNDQWSV